MIHGIGCDIVNVDRVARVLQKFGEKFVNKILTVNEIAQAKAKINSDYAFVLFLAKRYAAKEAYAKAVGHGLGKTVGFQDIEISNDEYGKPYFSRVALLMELGNTYLSLSDEPPYVISYVIIEKGV